MTTDHERDQLLACAVRFLIDGSEEDAASVLLSCSIEQIEVHGSDQVVVWLRGPRAAYDILHDNQHPVSGQVRSAIAAVLPDGVWLWDWHIRAELVGLDHERDRLFLNHGVRLVQHYSATECYADPGGVVQQFLALLRRS